MQPVFSLFIGLVAVKPKNGSNDPLEYQARSKNDPVQLCQRVFVTAQVV